MFDELCRVLSSHPVFSGGIALAIGGAAIAWLRRLPGIGIAAIRQRLIFTVEVHDREQCFAWFQQWLAGREESRRARNLVVKTSWGNLSVPAYAQSYPGQATGSYDPEAKAKLLLSPAPGTQLTRYRNRPVAITRSRREITSGGSPTGSYSESVTFRFFGADRSAIEAMLDEVALLGDERPKGIPVWTAWGEDWRQSAVLPVRSPESLSLAGGLLDDILGDIRRFTASGQWYADRGIPYRRGYLLHGPPGTGKTTLAPVIAGELGWSVATLNLGDSSMCDAQLHRLFNNLGRGIILVIEDIDCVFREREATSDKIGVTLSGLLNVLDGIGSKEGRILFMTTNHPERLDPALIRPGRIDRKIELGYATPDQARRMFAWFFKGHAIGDEHLGRLADGFAARVGDGVAPAAIQEHLLRHRDNPEEACSTFEDVRPIEIEVKANGRINGHLVAH